jgi:hypothetical protein
MYIKPPSEKSLEPLMQSLFAEDIESNKYFDLKSVKFRDLILLSSEKLDIGGH